MERYRDVGRASLRLVGIVVGLVEEADRIETLVEGSAPDRLALGISPGELATLEAMVAGEVEEEVAPSTSDVDEAYARHLSRFGAVRLPPPAYVRAVEIAAEQDLPVRPLDLDEEAFTETYTDHVGVLDLIRKSRRERRLAKHGVEADDAAEFADRWEARLLEIKGLRRVEEAREGHMARRLEAVCSTPGRVLAIVDRVRRPGVARRLGSPADG